MRNFINKLLYKLTRRVLINYETQLTDDTLAQLATCGTNVSISHPSFISGHKQISIGSNVSINAFVHIWGQGGVTIGDDCLIASHVTITSLTHNPSTKKFSEENIGHPIQIGNNVWIGSHAIILPGVSIGNNVIIGAGSLVNKNLEDNTVYVGTPAKELYKLKQF